MTATTLIITMTTPITAVTSISGFCCTVTVSVGVITTEGVRDDDSNAVALYSVPACHRDV